MENVNVENMTQEELAARVAQLQAENDALKDRSISLSVSEKGCVMVKGLRRFPVALYAEEWETILEMKDKILQFINERPELPRR